jgi:hypothetical protein
MFSISSEPANATKIAFNCPACGARGVNGAAFDRVEKLYQLIPVAKTTWVICGRCNEELLSRVPLEVLLKMPTNAMSSVIVRRLSPVVKLFAIASVVLFIFAPIGLICGLIGAISARKVRGWPYKISIYGIILSTFVGLAFFIGVMTGKIR